MNAGTKKTIVLTCFYYCFVNASFSMIGAFQLIQPKQQFACKQKSALASTSTQEQEQESTSSTSCIPSSDVKSQEFMNQLLSWFQGEFDNYPQILEERNENKEPPIGHEHIHCTLVPIPTQSFLHHYLLSNVVNEEGIDNRFLIAVYYLNGNPSSIFRSRLYHAFPEIAGHGNNNDDDDDESLLHPIVRCKIYDLHKEIKNILSEKAENSPWIWNESIGDFLKINDNKEIYFTELKGCDVLWSNKVDPIRHSYLPSTCTSKNNNAIHAIMEQEEVLKPSIFDPTKMLIIKDELSLWGNEIWINDRGYDANTGELAYGNALSIPYKLNKVCSFRFSEKDNIIWNRDVLENDLLWTLGKRNDAVDDIR